MIQEDTYKTITDIAEGIYTEKRSKFIAIAIPVRTIEEIKQHLDTYQKKYYDARHVCNVFLDREPLDSVTPDNFFFTENDLAALSSHWETFSGKSVR